MKNMPYVNNEELPPFVREYGEKLQSQWRHVFNTVLNTTKDEGRAFMAANSVLKARFKGKDVIEKNSRHDNFVMMVDTYLKNV